MAVADISVVGAKRQMMLEKSFFFLALAGLVLTVVASPALAEASRNAGARSTPSPIAEDSRVGILKVDEGREKGLRLAKPQEVALANLPESQAVGTSNPVFVPSGMPVVTGRTSSNFGSRFHPVHGGRSMHQGVDLAVPLGTPVYATAGGQVGEAGWSGNYGLLVQIDHGAQVETRYAHMSVLAVVTGQRVRKGDLIGYSGSTGRSTGPHLHYEVRMAGEAVDPRQFMSSPGR
jgi:murein DD-endopeptidase MepM/ murein hydrolase activator NlpD